MKEVSCKMTGPLVREAERQKHPVHILTEGTPYTLAQLKNGKERVHWHEFARIMANSRQFWSLDDIAEMGARAVASPWMLPITAVARLILSPRDFYFWINRPGQGAGNLMFTCIKPSCRDVGPNEVEIVLKLAEGYQPCREFFYMSIGGFAVVSQVLGMRRAHVTIEELPDGARYRVKYPSGGGWLLKLFKLIARPFRAQAAARQLMLANETLEARYQELETTRGVLALQATKLRTANEIGQLIHGDLD